jgi:hypothetical protein
VPQGRPPRASEAEAPPPAQVGGSEVAEFEAAVEGAGAEGRGAAAGAPGVRINPGVVVGPVGGLLVRVLAHYPKRAELYVTSG